MKWPNIKVSWRAPEAKVERKGGGKKSIPNAIEQSNIFHEAQNIRKWKDAVAVASDPKEANYVALAALYENLLLDAHTMSAIDSRVLRVQRSKFVLKKEDETAEEGKAFFQRPWFEDFVAHVLQSKFMGPRVLELYELAPSLELDACGIIPIQHLDLHKGKILKEPGGAEGWPYAEGPLANNYIPIGKPRDLGMLAQLAPLILAKKISMGSWVELIKKFGIPGIIAITDNFSSGRIDELFDMLMKYKNNHVAVLQGGESFQLVGETKSDPHEVFNQMILRINSEISKRILGQDGTMDNKDASGTYGSLKILQGVANDRHESDKLFVKHVINTELIPRLPLISSIYAPLNGLHFDWDESEDMSTTEYIDNITKLAGAGYVMDPEMIAEKTGMPVSYPPNGGLSNTNALISSSLNQKKKPITL